jgi:cytochrome c oxidase subunit 1
MRSAPTVDVDDPWGWGRSLEWATSCPPPRHNFTTIPRIRSESPAFDLHHPEVSDVGHLVTAGSRPAVGADGKDS